VIRGEKDAEQVRDFGLVVGLCFVDLCFGDHGMSMRREGLIIGELGREILERGSGGGSRG
jgi:hypothetical protein